MLLQRRGTPTWCKEFDQNMLGTVHNSIEIARVQINGSTLHALQKGHNESEQRKKKELHGNNRAL
jgi:hypothetical protein